MGQKKIEEALPKRTQASTPDQASASADVRSPLIEFPCYFPIKVMGSSQGDFIERIIMAVRALDLQFDASCIEQRASRTGRYTSLTCKVYAKSRAHLDDIYCVLTAHPMTAYVL